MTNLIKKYNSDGQLLVTTNEDEVFAKSISSITKEGIDLEQFLVKKGRTGPDASHLLNPNSIWAAEGQERAFDRRSGRKTFEFAIVTKDCFNLYIKFLQTKNPAYLRNAEREIQ